MTAWPLLFPEWTLDLWPDVHHALASQIRLQLMPLIQPKYVARISRYVVEDNAPESEIGIMYPDVEVLEIDLLRRGIRTVQHPKLGKSDYLIALTRAHQAHTDLWPVGLRSSLPTVPVPLAPPDADVLLDLQLAIRAVYEDAAYHLSIDYDAAPPPPEMEVGDVEWVKGLGK